MVLIADHFRRESEPFKAASVRSEDCAECSGCLATLRKRDFRALVARSTPLFLLLGSCLACLKRLERSGQRQWWQRFRSILPPMTNARTSFPHIEDRSTILTLSKHVSPPGGSEKLISRDEFVITFKSCRFLSFSETRNS